jgi:hypothetical protein
MPGVRPHPERPRFRCASDESVGKPGAHPVDRSNVAPVKGRRSSDYPWAWSEADQDDWNDRVEEGWGTVPFVRDLLRSEAPDFVPTDTYVEGFARYLRSCASPGTALAIEQMQSQIDARPILPTISVPTLALKRSDEARPHEEARYITDLIPGAKLVELPGNEGVAMLGDIDVSAGFDDAGNRQRITRTVKGTRRTAERELTTMLRDLDAGTLADGAQPLERYLTEDWLPAVSTVSKRGRALAPTTRQRYRDACRHVSKVIGKVRLDELRPVHVEKVRDRLLADGLAPQTVSDVLRVLSQALSRAEARGLVGRNPAAPKLVHRPIGERGRFTAIDATLGGRILKAAAGTDPWDAAAHLALGLGLRREEVLGLHWKDVDDAIHVRRTLTQAAGWLHFGPPKSAAGSP